jgi:hypothetical protein
MTSQKQKARYKTMITNEARKLIKSLTQEQKKDLLLLLVSLPSLDNKVKVLEEKYNIKLKD